jgi:hypothetical protein
VRVSDGRIALSLFAALTALYLANGPALPGGDSAPNALLAANLVEEGRWTFSPSRDPFLFDWVLETPGGPRVVPVGGMETRLDGVMAGDLYGRGSLVPVPRYTVRPSLAADAATGERLYVGTYGVGAGLAAAPVLGVVRAVVGTLREHPDALWLGARVAAVLFSAASAALVYLAARRWLSRGEAVALAVAYGVGTSVWSVSSQALWQHGPNLFFLSLGMAALARSTPRSAALAGAAFAAAIACRPTSAIFAVAIGMHYLLANRRAFVAYFAAALPIALLMGWYNLRFLGSPLRFAQTLAGVDVALRSTGSPDVWQTPLWIGLAGLLASPSRGLLVFSPFLGLGLAGAVAVWRGKDYAALRPLALAGALVLVLQAKWVAWWGGWSYGYRIIVDVVPALVLLAIPMLPWVRARASRVATVAVLLGWAVIAQVVGVFAYDPIAWNAAAGWRVASPSGDAFARTREEAERIAREGAGAVVEQVSLDVDEQPHRNRLWSVTDSQLVHSLTHWSEDRAGRGALIERELAAWREKLGGPAAAR